ncbi:polysaccharide deacetylase family protein [Solibacillus sp. FSL W7-1436]|uniref:polysaccharide deacetylase family protein n=1 Tax=Solibacillus sp. FSL W7-1436 TaxID=2921705 RepID=UPI0030F918D6
MTNLNNINSPISREERNKLNENFQKLERKNSNLQGQVNQLVVEGDSSPEAAQARVGVDGTEYTTLKQRIDSEYQTLKTEIDTDLTQIDSELQNVATQLAQKANKEEINTLATSKADKAYVETNVTTLDTKIKAQASGAPKGTYPTYAALKSAFPSGNSNIYLVSSDGNWYYWNNSDWVSGGVYQATQIEDNSITTPKISNEGLHPATIKDVEINENANLVNKSTVETGGYYNAQNGTYVINATYSSSDFIPVKQGVTYQTNYTPITYWNSNKQNVPYVGNENNFTIPMGVAYIRVAFPASALNTVKVSRKPKTLNSPYSYEFGNTWDVFRNTDYKNKLDIPLKNLVVNGNFADGANNWTKGVYTNTMTASNNKLTVNNGTFYYFGAFQNVQLIAGNKYYIALDVESSNFNRISYVSLKYADVVNGSDIKSWNSSGFTNGATRRLSTISTVAANSNIFKINFQSVAPDIVVSVNVSNVLVINLTAIFGDGNEPTISTMDELTKISGNWWNGELLDTNRKLTVLGNKTSQKVEALEIRINGIEANPNSFSNKFEIEPRLAQIMGYDFVCSIGYDDASASIYNYAFPVHQAQNVPGTFWVTTGIVDGEVSGAGWGDIVTWEQLREMQGATNGKINVESHSHGHISFANANAAKMYSDLSTAREIFLREGFNPKYFSYPGGERGTLSNRYISAYFEAARGANVNPGYTAGSNSYTSEKIYTDSIGIDTPSVQNVKDIILNAKNRPEMVWLDLYMHAVLPNGVAPGGSIVKTPEQLNELIQFVKDNNGLIISYDEAINVFMKNYYWTGGNLLRVKQ